MHAACCDTVCACLVDLYRIFNLSYYMYMYAEEITLIYILYLITCKNRGEPWPGYRCLVFNHENTGCASSKPGVNSTADGQSIYSLKYIVLFYYIVL